MKSQFLQKSFAFLVLVSLLCSFTTAFASTSQFEVNLQVGADVTPPSTPTGLTATAISSSQIDLSWTASTDNVGVTGYNIYRNAVLVTTVTGTTYSDIGLSPSTTYTYTVSAFDASSNVSGLSSSATATTLAAAVSPAPSGGGSISSQTISPVIYDLVVTPSNTFATISWKTTQPTVGALSWGQTQSYELGVSQETIYSTTHSMIVSSLNSATVYQFAIDVVNGSGVHIFTGNQSFETTPLPTGKPNAQTFTATAQTSDILLAWKEPSTVGVSEVRIMKSDSYFPTDPSDGTVVYEGNASSFSDSNVSVGKRYYYTLFVKYSDGTYSSGLVVTAIIASQGVVPPPYDIFGSIPSAPHVDPQIAALTFGDFDFIQNGKRISSFVSNSSVTIDGEKNMTVSIDYSKVPEVLKTIIVTLSAPDDPTKTFSFLLKVNSDKTAYEATIAPLGVSGQYGVKFSIVDFKNRGLKQIIGSLVATAGVVLTNGGESDYLMMFLQQNLLNLLLLLLLILIILRTLKEMVESHKKEEEKANAPKVQYQLKKSSLPPPMPTQNPSNSSDSSFPPQQQ